MKPKAKTNSGWKNLRVFSAWEFVGNDVLRAINADKSEIRISGTQIVAILVAAICPAALAESVVAHGN